MCALGAPEHLQHEGGRRLGVRQDFGEGLDVLLEFPVELASLLDLLALRVLLSKLPELLRVAILCLDGGFMRTKIFALVVLVREHPLVVFQPLLCLLGVGAQAFVRSALGVGKNVLSEGNVHNEELGLEQVEVLHQPFQNGLGLPGFVLQQRFPLLDEVQQNRQILQGLGAVDRPGEEPTRGDTPGLAVEPSTDAVRADKGVPPRALIQVARKAVTKALLLVSTVGCNAQLVLQVP